MIKTLLACLLACSFAHAAIPQKSKPIPLNGKYLNCHCDAKGKPVGCPATVKCIQKNKKK